MFELDETQRSKVREFIVKHFSAEELRTLCFDLGIEYDNLPGDGNAAKARELVALCQRHGRLPDLLRQLRQERTAAFDAEKLPLLSGEPAAALFSPGLVEEVPHPIACVCAEINAAQSDKERFEALDRLTTNLVKYMTAIALSQYWQDNPDRKQLRAWLGELSEARLVTSLNILNRVGDHYAAAHTSFIHPILFQPYHQPVDDDSPIAVACRIVGRFLPDRPMQVEAITPRVFLIRLLTLRETRWESDPGRAEAEIRETLLLAWGAALKQLLDSLAPLWRHPLRYIERVDRDGQQWAYTLVAFPGARGQATDVRPFCESAAQPAYKAHRLYLCSPDGCPLLNLHPILIAHRYKIYFLVCGGEKADLWYRHCASAERMNPPAYYRSLSASLFATPEQAAEQNDPVNQLEQASDELEKAESETRHEQTPLPVLLAHFDDDARQALAIGLGESLRLGHFWLGVEFLLMGLSKQEEGALAKKLQDIGIESGDLRGALRGLVDVRDKDWRKKRDVGAIGAEALPRVQEADSAQLAALYGTDKLPQPVITPRMMDVLREAAHLAGENKVSPTHLLLAAFQHPHCIAVNLLLGMLVKAGHDPREWILQLAQAVGIAPEKGESPEKGQPPIDQPAAPVAGPKPQPAQAVPKGKGLLGQLGRDLTELAKADQLRPAIGESAHKAMVQIGLILQQTQANNPILLGDPGVGKTAIVEGLAWRLAVGEQHGQPVAPQLADRRIVDLPPTALLSGTKYRGDLEERLQKLLSEVRAASGQTIVFIDEIHTILGGKAEGGLGAISDALKPALARGEFPCIGATTVGEYRRYIEADPALARRFTPVWIEEPSVEEAIEIVNAVAQQHLGIRIQRIVE
jgi:hypothetical protein